MYAYGIVLFNNILHYFVCAAVDFSHPMTKTEQQVTISRWIYRMTFFNSGLVPCMTGIISMNFFGNTGLIFQINDILIANFFVSFLTTVISWNHWVNQFQIWRLTKQVENKDKDIDYTQNEANKLFERNDFPIGERMSRSLKNLALAMFF